MPLVYLCSTLFGICHGGVLVARYDITSRVFGKMRFPQITGWQALLISLIGASSAPIAGAIYDATQSYVTAFVMTALVVAAGIACMLLFRPTRSWRVTSRSNG